MPRAWRSTPTKSARWRSHAFRVDVGMQKLVFAARNDHERQEWIAAFVQAGGTRSEKWPAPMQKELRPSFTFSPSFTEGSPGGLFEKGPGKSQSWEESPSRAGRAGPSI